jgi:hypothetical protein
MNVPFLQDTTFTGLISTKNYKTSQEWSQAYSLIQANSATWEESADILPTVTNYLSTNRVQISALTITNTFSGINSLTVFGNISASSTVYAQEGNSSNWNSAYQQTSASDLVRSNTTFETPTTGLSTIQNIVSLSLETYNNLTVKLPGTLYVVV